MYNVLDKIADLPEGGRIKCGYVWVMNDLLNGLHDDVIGMQKELAEKGKEPELQLELVGAVDELPEE